MRKEFFLLIGSICVSFAIGISIFYLIFGKSKSAPVDLQVVQLSEKKPAFFENVFQPYDQEPGEFLLNDPILITRPLPLFPALEKLGPHDLLGFRNHNVPRLTDVVTVGDSQTYGNNVVFKDSWPQVLKHNLSEASVYNMATGSWGALQYLSMVGKSSAFQPLVAIVAFYTGNDSLESFRAAYSVDFWKPFRINPDISANDIPSTKGAGVTWTTKIGDGIEFTFTPKKRLLSNDTSHPAVAVGYEIMKRVATESLNTASINRFQLFFTIIPTKELVYEKLVGEAKSEEYKKLVEAEYKNIESLTSHFKSIKGEYIDLLSALQTEVEKDLFLYPPDADGHPIKAGYYLIGKTIANSIKHLIRPLEDGLYVVNSTKWYLVRNKSLYEFMSKEKATDNGWNVDKATPASYRLLSNFELKEVVRSTDPKRYGPTKK